MTRDFSNQRQDDRRPSSRNTSSDNHREERPSYSSRPRLSRDAVDRAWENGASRTYADYRPRQTPHTSPDQHQGRPSSGFERSQSPQNRRPYNTRQENFRGPSSTYEQQRSHEQQERPQSPANDPRRFNNPGHRAPGGPTGLNSERWTRDQRGPTPYERNEHNHTERYQDQRRPAPYERNHFEPRQDQGGPRFRPNAPGGPNRNTYGSGNGPRPFERNQDNFARGHRPTPNGGGRRPDAPNGGGQRDNYNPRWQSRPSAQRDYSASPQDSPTPRDYSRPRQDSPAPRDYSRPRQNTPPARPTGRPYARPQAEQFEGDYERFDSHERTERETRPRQNFERTERDARPRQNFERPVTPLPDGRVLKGPRATQRTQARFWNEVSQTTDTLVPPTPIAPEKPEAVREVRQPARPTTRPVRTGKSPTGKTVRTARPGEARNRPARPEKINKKKNLPHRAQGPVMRPSQRGYKWPTSEE